MLDLGNYDLVAALRKAGCPLCRVLSEAEVRAMDAFIDAAGQLAEVQEAFCDGGGFCRDHAWLFHRRAALALTGAPVSAMYEALLRRDLGRLERLELELEAGSRNRRPARGLFDRHQCPACERARTRLQGKAEGLVAVLEEPQLQHAYRKSDGLCVPHLDLVGSEALAADRAVAGFLISDLRRRLLQIEERLLEYDRTRDYRFAAERTDAAANSWTDVVRAYVGDQYSLADDQ
jgi:hypothetical protein